MGEENLHVISPYRLDKNLGRAYNQAISHYWDEDWLVIKDYDVLFLTPDTLRHIAEYTKRYPDTGLFTCYTNRIGGIDQLLTRKLNPDPNIENHIRTAYQLEKTNLYKVTPIKFPLSGFLMVIKKATWNEIKFSEDKKCLGVDHDYDKKLKLKGKSILRMDGVYVWHTYRLLQGRGNTKHLL